MLDLHAKTAEKIGFFKKMKKSKVKRVAGKKKNSSALRRMDLDFPVGAMVRNLPANAGDAGLIPGSERSPGLGNDYPLQHSCLENSMDRGDWQTTVHGVTKSPAQLGH